MFAVIPYTTFPIIPIGPIQLRTFGLMVGIGVLVGAWVAARYVEQRTDCHARRRPTGWPPRSVIAGVIGARITWVITHWSQIHSPHRPRSRCGTAACSSPAASSPPSSSACPTFRRGRRLMRWTNLDGYALRPHDRPGHRPHRLHLGRRALRQPTACGCSRCATTAERSARTRSDRTRSRSDPTFHNTAIYELLWLLVLFGIC